MMLGDAMTPFDTVLAPVLPRFSCLFVKIKFELTMAFVKITSFEVPVFEITLLYPRFMLSAGYSNHQSNVPSTNDNQIEFQSLFDLTYSDHIKLFQLEWLFYPHFGFI